MKSLFTRLSEKITGHLRNLDVARSNLSLTGTLFFSTLAILFIGSGIFLALKVNAYYSIVVPRTGSSLSIGEIGAPQFINPVLAATDADKDLTALVYSGLTRHAPDGSLIPDLAQSWNISSDGKIYTFTLKKNAVFQDGTPVTTDDIVFTIGEIQNPAIKSPIAANWQGIAVRALNAKQVQFILPAAYSPFIENTTIGILPKHLWSTIGPDQFASASLNTKPVGSGPYQFSSLTADKNGVPTALSLQPFKNFILGAPFISQINFTFYPDHSTMLAAYVAKDVDSVGNITATEGAALQDLGQSVVDSPLPRIFGVFFNQTSNPVLADKVVRQALDSTVNRDYIVNTVLKGFAESLNAPAPLSFTPPGIFSPVSTTTLDQKIALANTLLNKDGWILNSSGIREKKTANGTTTLSFSLSTPNIPELKDIASILKEEWRTIGVDVSVNIFEGGYLNQDIIAPRNYDALLFGQVVGTDLDLYPFWDSKAIASPGLNIALYSSPKDDTLLVDMRTTTSTIQKIADYTSFLSDISNAVPAVFIYSPHLIYTIPKEVRGMNEKVLVGASDRFDDIYTWYINTDTVWKIFAHQTSS